MIVLMASEGLHYVSNGRIPSLMECIKKRRPMQEAPVIVGDDDEDDDGEDEDEDSSLPESARFPFYVTP